MIARQLGVFGTGARDVEDLHRTIGETRRRHRIAGGHSDRVDARRQIRDCQQCLAIAGIPDPKGLVIRSGYELVSVFRERDRLDAARVPGQRPEDIPTVDVKHLDRFIGRGSEELRATRMDGHAEYGARVASKDPHCGRSPDADRLVGAGRYY